VAALHCEIPNMKLNIFRENVWTQARALIIAFAAELEEGTLLVMFST